jgi:hypothetical protein
MRVTDTGNDPEQDALALGGILATSLVLLVPILAIFTSIPLLLWVVLVGVSYGLVIVLIGRIGSGVYAALLVTMTFVANIPLASASYLRTMSGSLGPNIWLAYGPLVALLMILFVRDSETFYDVSRAEILLGGFVGWVVFAAFVVRPLRLDASLFFALFVLWGSLVFGAIRRAHRTLSVSPRTTMSILTYTILCKSCFALVEGVRGGSFGLTHLGELAPELAETLATISIGPINLWVGTYVSGFTGMSFIFASLVVLTLPYVLSYTLDSVSPKRFIVGLSALVFATALRLTGTDAGRGAAILAVTLFLGWIALAYVADLKMWNERNVVAVVVIAIVCIAIVLVPSSQSGVPAGDV